MLKYLHIKQFALAEDLSVEFEPGLNILTGETGAGKSILVGAIAAVLGGRVFTEIVRTGADKAIVEAIFDISQLPAVQEFLNARGLPVQDELFLRREISVRGATRAFINDSPVTISTLAELGNDLVDIHGQHEHQSLLRRDTHRYFLDAYGRLQPILEDLAQKYERVRQVDEQLQALTRKQQELEEKYELYTFQLQEIEAANLVPGELEQLEEERRLLMNSEKLFELAGRLRTIFNGEGVNLLEMIGEVDRGLKELGEFSRELASLYQEFASARIVMEEAARSIEEFQNTLEFDPARLEEIESRINQIRLLQKKYGHSIDDILAYRDRIKAELALRENFAFEIERLEEAFRQALEAYREAALEVSRQRRKVAQQMEQQVQQQLELLGMPRTRFQVQIQWQENPHGLLEIGGKRYEADALGLDQIEFYISPNPGEDFKPLSKIASGGEISRIMLALKSILAEIDQIPTLIFDEIDVGVSGRIARAVGRSIQQLARSHQIICITHLPQIASHGKTHFVVEKYVDGERTFTRVVRLSDEKRVGEIAKLISGERVTETALASARQLIEEANLEQ